MPVLSAVTGGFFVGCQAKWGGTAGSCANRALVLERGRAFFRWRQARGMVEPQDDERRDIRRGYGGERWSERES